MSVIQSQQKEVRYLKRKSLEQESRIIGNALRDQIRQYGVDCVYYKLDTSSYRDFKDIVDQNTILRRAYGYNTLPDYTLSTHMITYADVQQDIFLLNKIGINPNVEIDFHFDRIDFACSFAPKVGQYREYKLDESTIVCEVPSPSASCMLSCDDMHCESCDISCQLLSCYSFPYSCEMLSGKFRFELHPYEYDNEYHVICNPYCNTKFNVSFPANNDLYMSLKYTIEDDEYLETLIHFTYRIDQIKVDDDSYKSMLSGKVSGSLLFYDIDQLGKYVDMIHPSIGDIVEIDFPDDKNKEKYEITDCYDKQLTQDGINPLLHKYIWKCKARRYINSFEDNTPQSDADDRVEEMHRYNNTIDEHVAKKISMYDELSNGITEDAAYGGMDGMINHYSDVEKSNDLSARPDGLVDSYDKQIPKPYYKKYGFIDDGSWLDIVKFASGSKLITDGYDLVFVDSLSSNYYQIATNSIQLDRKPCLYEQNLRWLKATDSEIVFINVEGESTAIVVNVEATQGQLEICLNSLFDKSLDDGRPLNANDQNFYKFKGTRTYLWSDGNHLYAKLESNHMLYQIDGMSEETYNSL